MAIRSPHSVRFIKYYSVIMSSIAIVMGLYHWGMALAVLATGLFALLFFIRHLYQREKAIAALSMQLNTILHQQKRIAISDYEEGELSVLKSEIQKMVTRLFEQADALQQEKVYLKDAIADISHQLRTPLTSLQLILPRLTSATLTERERMEYVSEMTQLIQRVDHLIHILLKISKIESGTATFQQQPVHIYAIVQQAAEPLLIPMELREQQFTITGSTTSTFIGDALWSVEAITNILKNAMEHTPAHGNIRVTIREQPLYTQITIENEGNHIAEEDLPHLFERFYQGRTTGQWNVGIGLALARMIIHQQNGTITVKNRPHNGVIFTIKFYQYTI